MIRRIGDGDPFPEPGDPFWGIAPFEDERTDLTSYRFTARGIAWAADRVRVRLEDGHWILTDDEDGRAPAEGRHTDFVGAVLRLIAARAGVEL